MSESSCCCYSHFRAYAFHSVIFLFFTDVFPSLESFNKTLPMGTCVKHTQGFEKKNRPFSKQVVLHTKLVTSVILCLAKRTNAGPLGCWGRPVYRGMGHWGFCWTRAIWDRDTITLTAFKLESKEYEVSKLVLSNVSVSGSNPVQSLKFFQVIFPVVSWLHSHLSFFHLIATVGHLLPLILM